MLLFVGLFVLPMFQYLYNVFLQILKTSQKTIKCQTFFLTKLQRFSFQLYLKRDSNTDVFLWIFQSFSENLLYRTSLGNWLRAFYLSEILVKMAFWMILQYFKSSSCKLSLWIVWLSQSLSEYCYLKISVELLEKDLCPQ